MSIIEKSMYTSPYLKNRKSIAGQEKMMKNGMCAKVIEDNGAYDIKIQFEDGYIARCVRSAFKKGSVNNPNIIKGSLLGHKAVMNCGLEAEVIEDNGSNDITVRFSDGYTKKTRRQSFKIGEINNPNFDRHSICGRILIMNCGMEAEVVEDNGPTDISVRFKDGYTTYHRERHAFIRRKISNPNCKKINFVGKKQMMICGMEAEVTEDFGFKNITVMFSDGTILTKQRRDTFLLGHIKNPNFDNNSIKGSKKMMNCGMEAEVIEDYGHEDITIKFLDGTIKEHCSRHNFLKGKIGNPNIANNYSLPQTLLYYFIHAFFPDAIYNYRPEWLRNRETLANLEIDVWIPSKKIGIEYDGGHWHKEYTQSSLEKCELITSTDEIETIITILERGSVVHKSPKHINYQLDYVSIYSEYTFLLKQLEETINKILNYLGVKSKIVIDDEIINNLYYNINPFLNRIISAKEDCKEQRIRSIKGQKMVMNCGMEAEVIEDSGYENITIKFADGTVIKNRNRYDFFAKSINNPNVDRHSIKGQCAMMNCGMEAEVIEDDGPANITLRFADGYVSRKRTRQEFKRGCINNPNVRKGSLLGQEKVMKNGLRAKVIEDNGAFDVIIQFEDGYITHCVRSTFKNGRVKNPNIIKGSLLGQKAMMNCGLEAEVIEDNGSNDITVRFADGYTKKTKRQAFKNRQIDNPNRHSLIGKKLMMKCGMEAEVIEDKGAEKITIKFVDGTIITNRDRYSFLTQTINNFNYNRHSIVGQKAFMRCCLEAEVIEDFGYNDITVRFSNGVIKKHCPRQSFRNKKLTPFTRR